MLTVTPTANPCLHWLLDDGSPPFPMGISQVAQAVTWLEARLTRVIRGFLRHPPQTDRYLAVLKADRDLATLETWTLMTGPYHGTRAERSFEGMFLAMNTRNVRRWQRLNLKGAAFREHLMRLQRKLRRAGDTRWDGSIRETLDDAADNTYHELQNEADRFVLRANRREARAGRKIESEGGTLFSHWPARANPALEEEARLAALRRQERGFLVYPTEDPGTHLMQRSKDAHVRQQIWLNRQAQVCVRPADIEKMRQLRHAVATHMNHDDHVAYQMHGTTFLTPDRAERVMQRSLDQLRGPMKRAARRGAARKQLAAPTAADFGFALTHGSNPKDIPTVSPRAFPWRSTTIKVMNELMALGGWTSVAPPKATGRGTSRLLRFFFCHESGRRAQVLYGPFNPSPSPNNQVAAQACLVRTALAEETHVEQVCMIDHRLPAERPHFNLMDLQYLCHEIGHVLHFLALPGHTFLECGQLTADFSEVPSILLESYYRQPETLIRWLGPQAPKSLRKRAYWTCRLRRDPIHTRWYQRSMLRAYLDLRLHRKDSGTLDEVVAEVQTLAPCPWPDEQRDHLNYFDWSTLSGMGISHLAGEAMAHRLLPIPTQGVLASEQVGAQFQRLLSVLTKGVSGPKLRRAWRQWAGESMTTSMDEGFRDLTRHYAALVRDQKRKLN